MKENKYRIWDKNNPFGKGHQMIENLKLLKENSEK